MNGRESFGRVYPAAANNIKELDDISSGLITQLRRLHLTIGGTAYQPRNAAMFSVSLGGVIQEPGTDYTVSTSTITFTTAPNAGLDFFGVVRGMLLPLIMQITAMFRQNRNLLQLGQTSLQLLADIQQDILMYSEMV